MGIALEKIFPAIQLKGEVRDRMRGNLEQWLLPAPRANPSMIGMFRLRERLPRMALVPWYGEFPGKYLISAALAYRVTGSRALQAVGDGLVADLASVLSSEGYLGPHPLRERLTGSTAGAPATEKTAMVPPRKLWDVWGHYQVILGLLTWHEATGSAEALRLSLRAADHVCAHFLGRGVSILEAGDTDKNTGIIHALCLLHRKTGKADYLSMARHIEESWDDPSAGGYLTAGIQGIDFHLTRLPRWESLHAIEGIFEMFRITGDARHDTAFRNIWWSIVRNDRHNSGGFSSGEKARGNPYDPRPIETCCTVAWMALSVDMLQLTGDPYVADELELSFLNGTLGAQHPSGRWWTYNTPMDGVRKASAHDIVFQAIQGSPELNCCSVNGPRGLGMLVEWALMSCPEGIVLNYYGPCVLRAALSSGRSLRIAQKTRYPEGGAVKLELGLEQPEGFELKLRIPGWSSVTRVAVNGEAVEGVRPGTYLAVTRTWRDGDVIELAFEMSPHFWVGERECAGKVSLYRGPILLAYDQAFNEFDPADIPAVEAGAVRYGTRTYPTTLRPWMRVTLGAAGGRTLTLCDFASAGASGSRYVTWLPANGFTPAPYRQRCPEWFGR